MDATYSSCPPRVCMPSPSVDLPRQSRASPPMPFHFIKIAKSSGAPSSSPMRVRLSLPGFVKYHVHHNPFHHRQGREDAKYQDDEDRQVRPPPSSERLPSFQDPYDYGDMNIYKSCSATVSYLERLPSTCISPEGLGCDKFLSERVQLPSPCTITSQDDP